MSIAQLDGAAVIFHYFLHDGQSEPGALVAGGDIRLGEAMPVALGQPAAVVGHGHGNPRPEPRDCHLSPPSPAVRHIVAPLLGLAHAGVARYMTPAGRLPDVPGTPEGRSEGK